LGKQVRIQSALIQTGSAFTMKAKPYPLSLQHARHVKVLKHHYTKVWWYFETLCQLNS